MKVAVPKLLNANPWLTSVAASVFIGGIGLVTGILLARTLGPVGRGMLAESLLWPGFVLILGSIVNLQTGTYFWTKAKSSDYFSCHTVMCVNLLLSALLTVVLIVIGLCINFLALGLSQKQSFGAANVYLASIPLSMFNACFLSVFLAEERYDIFWGLRILQPVLYLSGLLILLLIFHLSVFNIVLVILIAMFVQLAATAGIYLGMYPFQFSFSRRLAITAAWYGARTNLTGLPYHLNARLDQLLMSLLLPAGMLGYYVVAVAWSSLLSFVGNGASLVMLPQSASLNPGDRNQISQLIDRLRVIVLALVVIGAAAALVSPFAIRIFFGEEYGPAIMPAMILCIAGSILNGNLVIHEMARGFGHPGLGMWAEGVGLVVTVSLLFALLPIWGALGAAIASLLSYSAVFILLVFLVSQRIGASTREFIPQSTDIVKFQAICTQAMQAVSRIILMNARYLRTDRSSKP